jgi:phage tail sheath protein FI
MAFLVSPGVEVKEIDLTNVVPAVSTSVGGIVGNFRWGPVEKNITVGSEKDLANQFGKPTTALYSDYFVAAGFLNYGNNLKVHRVIGTSAKNAHTNQDSPNADRVIKNEDGYDALTFGGSPGEAEFYAKYPGALGNSLKVHVLGNSTFATHEQATQFDSAPGAGEIHIAIEDDTGDITGTAGEILERFTFLDLTSGSTRDDGSNNYYYDVLNTSSAWIWAGEPLSDADSPTGASDTYTLANGADDTSVTRSTIAGKYSGAFGDAETVDVNLIIGGEQAADDANTIVGVAGGRKDAIAFVSPLVSSTHPKATEAAKLTAVTTFADSLTKTGTNASFGFADSGAVYVYDKYNDRNVYIAASGHIAGLCANTDRVAESWFSPAGFNRGALLGVSKLAYNPSQSDRDTLYKKNINPIVSFPGQGIVLFGDKTLQSKPSAFDRINVRRLFSTLEKAISTAAKFQLFELNDEFTRAQFRNLVEPFLRDVQGRRGITDFLVVCDETNNTGEVIDSNRFVADIFIKPARSINFITLNFIATRTGVEFSEIVGTN